MLTPLRVLIVEDSERDCLLVLRALHRGGFEPIYRRVDQGRALEAALAEGGWEVLIADHSLPGLDSLDALALVKQRGLDIPFIIVSGTIQDETAVEAMRAGAHDYIFKDNLSRLAPAVKRELQEAEERRNRREAEASLVRYDALSRSLIENAFDLIGILRPEGTIAYLNPAVTKLLGYPPFRLIGRSVFELVHPEDRAIFADSLALSPSGNASLLECRMRHNDGSWRMIEAVTNKLPEDSQETGVVICARDVTARKNAELLLRQTLGRVQVTLDATVSALSLSLANRDPYTVGHQERVTEIASAIAQTLYLSEEQRETVRLAGTLHDIGKISVPAEVLSRPGKLTQPERALIQNHPQVGFAILKDVPFVGPVAETVLQHHERLDGSGYPAGLSGEMILFEARILAVGDVVEAMSSHRPYRPALGLEAALDEIRRGKATRYDAQVADACLELFASPGLADRLELEPPRKGMKDEG